MKEKIQVKGELLIKKFRADGTGKPEIIKVPNLIVNGGLTLIARRIWDTGASLPGFMAIGTGTTAPTKLDTTLQAQLLTRVGTNATGTQNKAILNTTFGVEFVGSITEAGIFTESVGGTMISRSTFAPVNKTAEDLIVIEWTYTIGTWGV